MEMKRKERRKGQLDVSIASKVDFTLCALTKTRKFIG
jgi:hypothetical protein